MAIKLDCDVLVADGGTRTASITGACVAAVDAFSWLASSGRIAASPVKRRVADPGVALPAAQLTIPGPGTNSCRSMDAGLPRWRNW